MSRPAPPTAAPTRPLDHDVPCVHGPSAPARCGPRVNAALDRLSQDGSMKTLDRALSLRRSTRLRSVEPSRVFESRLLEPRRLLSLAEKDAHLRSTRFEARRQFLVALTAAMELFWRALARTSIDRCRPPVSALSDLRRRLSPCQTSRP